MSTNPAQLYPHDPAWLSRASEQLDRIAAALSPLPGADRATYDHIGSTSVPGLRAKPFIDLQVRLLPMPDVDELISRLGQVGYARALGSRPDSPGVYRDIPRGDEIVPDEVWEKSIFTNSEVPAILHVRRADSP